MVNIVKGEIRKLKNGVAFLNVQKNIIIKCNVVPTMDKLMNGLKQIFFDLVHDLSSSSKINCKRTD